MDIPLSVPELTTWLMNNIMLLAMSAVVALIVVQIMRKRAYRLTAGHILIGLVLFLAQVILLPILLPSMF